MGGAGKTPLDLSNLHTGPLEVCFQATPHFAAYKAIPCTPRRGPEGTQGCTHEAAGIADAPQARTDVIPDADAAPADPLPHRQLQEEEGEPDDDEQDQVRDQVGTWQERESSSRTRLCLLSCSQGRTDRDGQAGQSWDRLCLVHQFICNGPGNADQRLGSREDSCGEEQTHVRGRKGCNIPCQRGYMWERPQRT